MLSHDKDGRAGVRRGARRSLAPGLFEETGGLLLETREAAAAP